MSLIPVPAAMQAATRGFYPLTIDQSIRFNDDDSARLQWTPSGTATDRKKVTLSVWVKRGNILTTGTIINARSGAPWCVLAFSTGDGVGPSGSLQFAVTAGSSPGVYTSRVFRDPSAWYHIVCSVDTTQATASNRVKIWINGEQETLISGNYPTLNQEIQLNSNILHEIGNPSAYSNASDFYLADFYNIDGQALTPSSFAETKNGVWVPIEYTGTYGTNGFHITGASDGVNAFYDYTGNFTSKTLGSGLAHSSAQAKWGDSSIIMVNNAYYDITGSNSDLFPSGSNQRTYEFWVYYNSSGAATNSIMFRSYTSDYYGLYLYISGNNGYPGAFTQANGGGGTEKTLTSDTALSNGWNHVAYTWDSTVISIYLNGTRTGTADHTGSTFGDSGDIRIGVNTSGSDTLRYIDDVRISSTLRYTGTSYTVPTAEFVEDSNTLFMLKSDYIASDAIGSDSSGNNNHWSDVNLQHNDVVSDSPTDNFATLNPLDEQGSANTLSDGNLVVNMAAAGSLEQTRATMGVSSGQFYWEAEVLSSGSDGGYFRVGLKSPDHHAQGLSTSGAYWMVRGADGETEYMINNSGTQGSSSVDYDVGDIIMVAVDMDAGKWWVGVNGTWVGDPVAGTGAIHDNLYGTVIPFVSNATSAATHVGRVNFGQQPFKYDPPA